MDRLKSIPVPFLKHILISFGLDVGRHLLSTSKIVVQSRQGPYQLGSVLILPLPIQPPQAFKRFITRQ